MRKLLCLTIFFLYCQQIVAQVTDPALNNDRKRKFKYRIYGQVTDADDGLELPYTPVFFSGTSVGTSTDEDGKYELGFDSFPGDSIIVQVLGYKRTAQKVDKEQRSAEYNFQLERSSNMLGEAVVRPGQDPAIALMKNVIRFKNRNNPDKLDNYKYEAYNKIELDLLNLKRKTFESLPVPYLKKLGFVFDNVDSFSYSKPFLPFYFTEALSDYYYQKDPKRTKEYVKASQVKVVTNKNMTQSMSQYLGKLYLAINPYDNYLPFFDKEFVSPLSNNALGFYKYKIVDTQEKYGYTIITVRFEPQRKGEQCFEGELKIVKDVFAVQYIGAAMPGTANINWVKKADFYREYTPLGDTLWFCTKENITAELELTQEPFSTLGFVVRKTTSYKDIVVNDSSISEVVESKFFKRDVVVADSATETSEAFWATARHDTLNKNEQGVYDMYDSLEHNKSYNRLKTLGKIIATGGYKFGPIELGPYWNAYSNNRVEGNRFQFTMGTTPKLFKDVYINGYVAYGVGDNRFKYNANVRYITNRAPRRYFNFAYTRDIDNTVNYYDKVGFNNILSVAIRKKGIPWKFMFADNVRLEYYNEFFSGFSQLFTIYRKIYDPYDPLPSTKIFQDVNGTPSKTVTATEVSLRLRFAYKERFLNGNYLRYSLGSKYPIVELRLALGLKDVWESDYGYQRVNFTLSDNWRIPPFGQLYISLFAGKYFGKLPYPLLEQHPGNELYVYNKYAFNMMNQYEFLSDEYFGINLEHSLGGGFLKYVPLIKKLKWRQFWTAKSIIGSLSQANKQYNFDKGFTFRSLEGEPYLELGTGIENIFRVFRVDFVWRVTPKSLPNETVKRDFGIFGGVKLAF